MQVISGISQNLFTVALDEALGHAEWRRADLRRASQEEGQKSSCGTSLVTKSVGGERREICLLLESNSWSKPDF